MLSPRSVAVIGASDQPGNLGGDTVRRLQASAFPGPSGRSTARGEPVAGLEAYASVRRPARACPISSSSPFPAAGLAEAIRDCAAAGVRHGVAYAGGLAESGRAEGIALQRELVALCRERRLHALRTELRRLHQHRRARHRDLRHGAARGRAASRPASISIVSQSGGIGTTAMSSSCRRASASAP